MVIDDVINRQNNTISVIIMKQSLQVVVEWCLREFKASDTYAKPIRDRLLVITSYKLVDLTHIEADLIVDGAEIEVNGLLFIPQLSLNHFGYLLKIIVNRLFYVNLGTFNPFAELLDFLQTLHSPAKPQVAPPSLQALRCSFLNEVLHWVFSRIVKAIAEYVSAPVSLN